MMEADLVIGANGYEEKYKWDNDNQKYLFLGRYRLDKGRALSQ